MSLVDWGCDSKISEDWENDVVEIVRSLWVSSYVIGKDHHIYVVPMLVQFAL